MAVSHITYTGIGLSVFDAMLVDAIHPITAMGVLVLGGIASHYAGKTAAIEFCDHEVTFVDALKLGGITMVEVAALTAIADCTRWVIQ